MSRSTWTPARIARMKSAIEDAPSVSAAAEQLGISRGSIEGACQRHLGRSAASLLGGLRTLRPSELSPTPPPDMMQVQQTSTLYDAAGGVRQRWVKQAAPKGAEKLDAIREALEGFAEPFKSGYGPSPGPPPTSQAEILSAYVMGDPHFGMLAHKDEAGDNFDLATAERLTVGAIDRLVSLAEPSHRAMIVNTGDFFHCDNDLNRTRRSNAPLDVDGRHAKVARVGCRAMRRCIERALDKHQVVEVVCAIGNHDDASAMWLSLVLEAYFSGEPRVIVRPAVPKFHYVRFGSCLIGVTHGDTVKPAELPSVMAVDAPQDWGNSTHRHWYTGHVHHESIKEYRGGVTVETARTMAARDSWHAASGYRSGRDMRVDTWHAKHGRINRHIVGVSQVAG